jgi:transcriptional regulator with XRE-family HTH domain
MSTNKSWGEKIKKLRESKKLSQEDLAKDMNKTLPNTNFSKQSISYYELGQSPSIDTCYKYSKYFNVSMNYLYDENIESKQFENISFNKELGLSDEAIRKLKSLNKGNKVMIDTVQSLGNSKDFTLSDKIKHFEAYVDKEFDEILCSNRLFAFLLKLRNYNILYSFKSIFEDFPLYEQEDFESDIKVEKRLEQVELYIKSTIKTYESYYKKFLDLKDIIHSYIGEPARYTNEFEIANATLSNFMRDLKEDWDNQLLLDKTYMNVILNQFIQESIEKNSSIEALQLDKFLIDIVEA